MTEQVNEAAAAVKAAEVADDDHHVVLRVVFPAYCTHFNLPRGERDTLVVTRAGTKVAASEAESVKKAATACGVTLVEVS
jgi:hypothetical protein